MVTSIAKLQKNYDILYKKHFRQTELLTERKEKYNLLQKKYQYLEKTMEDKIKMALENFKDNLLKENEALKKENEKLKKLLNMDSNNSGIPTSQTNIRSSKRIPNTREKSNKLKGGQVGHPKNKLEPFKEEEITDTYIHEVTKCNCGSSNLKDLGIRVTKDCFDVDIRVQKISNEFHDYKCLCCGKIIKSPVPLHLKEANQYGNNVKGLALSLINEGCVSYNRTKKLISGFTNNEVNMSEGFMVKLQKQCATNLTNFINDLKVKILNERLIHWDDTVIMINTKRSCLRYYGNELLALYTAHERKNKEGLDEDNILNNLSKKTVVMHDHNKVNYNKDYNFENAECCVHLIRDLRSLNENLKREWIDDLITLLITTNNERKEYLKNKLYFENKYIKEVIEKYDAIIIKAKEKNKTDFSKYYGNDEKCLIKRLEKYKSNYLMWVVRFDVPFDNNNSERSLRMSKTKMKVSGQFNNIGSARNYVVIKSYIETCKRNGLNEHIAITKLLEGKPYAVEEILKNND